MSSTGEDNDSASTTTAVGPSPAADKESRTRILIVETDEADASGEWGCTNDNVDEFYPSSDSEFFNSQLIEFLSDYLAQPAFESWSVARSYLLILILIYILFFYFAY